jgi:hypothetical protein
MVQVSFEPAVALFDNPRLLTSHRLATLQVQARVETQYGDANSMMKYGRR